MTVIYFYKFCSGFVYITYVFSKFPRMERRNHSDVFFRCCSISGPLLLYGSSPVVSTWFVVRIFLVRKVWLEKFHGGFGI